MATLNQKMRVALEKPMAIPLRVLLIEDSDDDAELILHQLAKDGYNVAHERLQTAEDVKSALDSKTWDIVISDHFMPGFTSADALTLVREREPDLPFIIVSGAIGEDMAVAAMKAGADDILLKDRLGRLSVAIERELREANERKMRKQAEQALYESEERFRIIAEHAPVMIWMSDIDKRMTYFNGSMLDFTGRSLDRLLDGGWLDELHPHDRERCMRIYHDAFDNRQSFETECRLRRFDGSYRWLMNRGVPRFTANGRFVGYLGTCLDITSRKEAEASARQLAAIVESSDDAIISITLDGTITSWNTGAERIFGYRSEEVIGRAIYLLIPPERQPEETQMLDKLVRGERVAHFETVRLDKSGRPVDMSLTLSPIRDEFGTIIGASKIGRDISEQKRTRETLKEANRRKDEFLAMLAHELRNPLASIRNATEIFGMLAPPIPSLRQAQEMSERQMRHLTRLVDDLLDVSRITLGKITLSYGPANVREAILAAIEINRHLIESKRHQLDIGLAISPSSVIAGDAVRLAQIFGNLLNNAAKYTEDGGRISIFAEEHGTDVIVRVKDNGIGIASDVLPRIFDLFTQADRSLDRAQGGLGIGLSLVKNLVELHGGSVDVYSNGSGEGSEFVVRLPLIPVSVQSIASHSNTQGAEPSTSLRVLVVDDNADSADSMAVLLELQGYQVSKAHNGIQALEVARECRPQVVLLDIGLPGMDGFEVARRLRKMPETDRAFIIALTGYGQADDFKRSKDAGFDHHLVKPVELSVLQKIILDWQSNETIAVH